MRNDVIHESTACGEPTVVECPPTELIAYSVELAGGWNAAEYGELGVPTPYMVIAALAGDITPAPPAPFETELAIAIPLSPIVGEPVEADVPGPFSWQVMSPYAETGFVGIMLPLAFVPETIDAGDPVWIRHNTRDGNGCVTSFYIFIPSFPGSDADEVTLYVTQDGETFDTLTVEPAPAPGEEGPTVTYDIVDLVPTCPAPKRALAVAPVCGFPVQVTEFDLGEGSLPVSVNGAVTVEGAGGAPVPVAIDTKQMHVYMAALDSGAVATTFFQASSIKFTRTDEGVAPGDTITISSMTDGGNYSLEPGETLELVAPPGQELDGIEADIQGDAILKYVQVGPAI